MLNSKITNPSANSANFLKYNFFIRIFCLFAMIFFSHACSTITKEDLATKDDYLEARSHFINKNYGDALKSLPAKEKHGFIITLEKAWLSLLSQKDYDNTRLTKYSQDLDLNKTLRLKSIGESFFYRETSDGYFPGEHETILLHIINGMIFARKSEWDKARVEARAASLYLEIPEWTGGNQGKIFDDPAIRMWLGALWLSCGRWQEAKVDFRKAAILDPKLQWLNKFIESAKPPSEIQLFLAGSGAEPIWSPEPQLSVESGLAHLKFKPSSEPLSLFISGKRIHSVPTLGWYRRHQLRNHEIRSVLEGTRYTVEGITATGLASANMAIGAAASATVSVGGVILGTCVGLGGLYLGIKVGSDLGGTIALLGLAGGSTIITKSLDVAKTSFENAKNDSENIFNEAWDLSPRYRFVRLMPEYLYFSIGKNQNSVRFGNEQNILKVTSFLTLTSPDSATIVDFIKL